MKKALNNTEVKMRDSDFGSCNECIFRNHSTSICVAADCFTDTIFLTSSYLSDIFKL